jgi:hypothetical protein
MRTFAGHRGFTSIFNCSMASLFILAVPRSALSQDISITDFRIPTSKYERFVGTLSGQWYRTNTDNSTLNAASQKLISGPSSWLDTYFDYNLGDFSEDRSLEIFLDLTSHASYDKNDNSWTDFIDTTFSSSRMSRKSYQLNLNPLARYSNYLIPDAWHWFIEVSGNYSFYQSKNTYDQTSNTVASNHDVSSSKGNDWNASLGAGIGYGKVRDGSAVFGVLRILDKLKEDSILVRPLSNEEILKLVNIFARRTEYIQIHDRYVKFLMGDLFGELQKMRVLKNNAPTAYSVERAVEVLSEHIEPRLFGWRARLGLQRRYIEQKSTDDNSQASVISNYVWNFHDYLQLAVDYGYPVSLNFHITSSLSLGVPRIDYERKINANFNVKGIYQIGERIDATVSGSMLRNQFVNGNIEEQFIRSLNYNAGISFRFFIENQISFNVSGLYSKTQWDKYSPFDLSRNVTEGPHIILSLAYRFI